MDDDASRKNCQSFYIPFWTIYGSLRIILLSSVLFRACVGDRNSKSPLWDAMRVSEADVEERNQCSLPSLSTGARNGSIAVCRIRSRCSMAKIVRPVRLCRMSGRSVMGRTSGFDNVFPYAQDRLVDDFIMARIAPEGICCRMDAPATTSAPKLSSKVSISTSGSKDVGSSFSNVGSNEIVDSQPANARERRKKQSWTTDADDLDIISYSNNFLSRVPQDRPLALSATNLISNPLKSYTAINIGDLGLDCGRRNLSFKMMRMGRIVGGQTAGFSDWPWVVMILNYGRPRCGGTLISNRTVLTAAHCISGNILLYNLTVNVGMFNTQERDSLPFPPVHVRVEHIYRHPEFDLTTLLNDVAVLELSEAVAFAPNIMPACLASQQYPARTSTIILGWGKEEENNTVYELPDSLQAVSVPIYNREECTKYFNQQGLTNLIGDQHICAGSDEGGKDACQGDSGGPMIVANPDGRFELIGIISWGFGCGTPHVPAVYTNIFHYRKWIIETVKLILSPNIASYAL